MLVDSPAAVAQAIQTRLKLRQGEWFLDSTQGMPYDTDVVGTNKAATRDLAFQTEILKTTGVSKITEYASYVDPTTRKFSVAVTVDTKYGSTTTSTTSST